MLCSVFRSKKKKSLQSLGAHPSPEKALKNQTLTSTHLLMTHSLFFPSVAEAPRFRIGGFLLGYEYFTSDLLQSLGGVAGEKLSVWEGLFRALLWGLCPWEEACVIEELLSGLSICLAKGLQEPGLGRNCYACAEWKN